MEKLNSKIETLSEKFTKWIGSPSSLIVHTVLFIAVFVCGFLGYSWDTLLLILTTAVSLEAIYLAIFIQMSINKSTYSLKVVEENIDEIQEDIDEIQEDVDEIQEDVDEIQNVVINPKDKETKF
jgi:low affinity Fe/Cu permease